MAFAKANQKYAEKRQKVKGMTTIEKKEKKETKVARVEMKAEILHNAGRVIDKISGRQVGGSMWRGGVDV